MFVVINLKLRLTNFLPFPELVVIDSKNYFWRKKILELNIKLKNLILKLWAIGNKLKKETGRSSVL